MWSVELNWIAAFCGVAMALTNGISQHRTGDEVRLQSDVTGDQYCWAATVTVDAPVNGDVVAFAGTLTINDTILGDVVAAGGEIKVNGVVTDDVRAVCGQLDVSGTVLGDLLVAGGDVLVDSLAVVAGDVMCAGGNVVIKGKVNGAVTNTSGDFVFKGICEKGITSRADFTELDGIVSEAVSVSSRKLVVGRDAVFHSPVKYWAKKTPVDFGNSMRSGDAVFDPDLAFAVSNWRYLGFSSFILLLWFIFSGLLLLFATEYLFGKTFRAAAEETRRNSGKALLTGLAFVFGLAVLIVVSFVTFVAAPVGILLILIAVVLTLFSSLMIALTTAHWINNTFYQRRWGNNKIVLVSWAILLLLKLFLLTPFVGPLVTILLVLVVFGGIFRTIHWRPSIQ